MKAVVLSIDTSELHEVRHKQSCLIRRSYKLALQGHDFKSIQRQLAPEINGHLYRSGIQRGIDLAQTNKAGAIFGGRKQFIRRCKGLLTNEEWKQHREHPLYSIGRANQKGNLRLRLDYLNRKLIYKGSGQEYSFDLPKLQPNWEMILEEIARKSNNHELALTYMVGHDSVSIIYDEQKLDCYKVKYQGYQKKQGRYLGIDLNPDRIGIAVYQVIKVGTPGEVIHAEQFELTSDDQAKRQNEVSHFCDAIHRLMKHYKIHRVGMEDLDFQPVNHGGRKLNKTLNFWIRTFIKAKIKMICQLTNTQFCNINPAYSSFIGTLRHPDLGDCCGAAAEIARRCGYQKSEFYPGLIHKTTLVHRWKEMAGVAYDNWVGLYEAFKIRHLGWRSPPRSSRSSVFGAWSERLLVHQSGVSF